MTLDNTDAGNTAGSAVADVPANGNAPPSIDDTLKSLYREKMAVAEPEGTEATPEEGTEPAPVQGRQHAPDGKFLPSKAEAAAPTEEKIEPEETPAPVVAKPHDAPPNTWRKEVANEFGKLPENVREEIHRRENDFHKGIGQYKEAAEFGTVMAQELLPFQQTMTQHNVNARDVVKSLANSWNMLVTGSPQQKAQLVLQLVKDYGIDFASLGSQPQQAQSQPTQEDPRLAAALQRLEKIEGSLTAADQERQRAEEAATISLIEKFGSDPAHKHLALVEQDIFDLLNAGLGKGLDKSQRLQMAYDKAIWANPESRKLLLAEQDKARADKAAADAAAARKAAGANVTRRGTPPVPQKTGKIEDTIKSRYRELMS
jgi:hypothetical protein